MNCGRSKATQMCHSQSIKTRLSAIYQGLGFSIEIRNKWRGGGTTSLWKEMVARCDKGRTGREWSRTAGVTCWPGIEPGKRIPLTLGGGVAQTVWPHWGSDHIGKPAPQRFIFWQTARLRRKVDVLCTIGHGRLWMDEWYVSDWDFSKDTNHLEVTLKVQRHYYLVSNPKHRFQTCCGQLRSLNNILQFGVFF